MELRSTIRNDPQLDGALYHLTHDSSPPFTAFRLQLERFPMTVTGATAAKRTPVKTVDRLVRVLECFSPERPAWSLAELSAQFFMAIKTEFIA